LYFIHAVREDGVVDIAERSDLDVRHLGKSAQMIVTAAAKSDNGMADPIVRAQNSAAQSQCSGAYSSCLAGCLQKVTPIHIHSFFLYE
jgi:hypothetical protein